MYVLNFKVSYNEFLSNLCVDTELHYYCVNVLRFQNLHLYYILQIVSTHLGVMGM